MIKCSLTEEGADNVFDELDASGFFEGIRQSAGIKQSDYDPSSPEKMLKAKEEAAKLIDAGNENGAAALKEDAEFWNIAVQINPNLLFLVPGEYKTK